MDNLRSSGPHVVTIVADQWRGDALGFLGNEHPVMTPHLDQLATEGIYYSSAYADCPICMPQRIAMLTGRTASQTGLTDNYTTSTPVDPSKSLPGRLTREAGYQTHAIGKMHVLPDRARLGFEQVELLPDDYVNYLESVGWGGHYRSHGLGGNEVYPAPSGVPERHSHNRWIVDRAVNFVRTRDRANPFYLNLIFEAPHSPFDPPPEYRELYSDLPIPEPLEADWELPPSLMRKRSASRYDLIRPEIVAKARQAYYAQLTHIDYQLGRLLGELKTQGLYDETIIVFTSDHGDHLGDYGLFGKTTFLHGSAHIPLIVKPERQRQLDVCPVIVAEPVITADIAPTILDAVGLAPFDECDGRILTHFSLGEPADSTRIVFGEYGESSAFAASKDYKYLYFTEGGIEMAFNRTNDPCDLRNIVNEPEYRDKIKTLRDQLRNYLAVNNRPMIQDGSFVITNSNLPDPRLSNTCAWRGPMRYGQGYGGGW